MNSRVEFDKAEEKINERFYLLVTNVHLFFVENRKTPHNLLSKPSQTSFKTLYTLIEPIPEPSINFLRNHLFKNLRLNKFPAILCDIT